MRMGHRQVSAYEKYFHMGLLSIWDIVYGQGIFFVLN